MKNHFLSLLPIALCVPLMAQTGTVPPGYDSTESSGSTAYSYLLARYANMRAQVANADLTGKGAKVLTEISFRQDGSVSSSSGVARTFTQVTLMMAETKMSSLSSTWALNFLTTPTTVYSAKHSFPDITKQPSGAPNPWDNGGLRFPFTSRFAYTGSNDLLLDMTMLGGSLANSAAWGTTSTGSSPSFTYYLDGRSIITSAGGSLFSAGLTTSTCPTVNDSSSTATTGPNSYFWHWSYAKDTGNPTTSNKMQYYFQVSSFPPSIPVIQGVSLNGTRSHTDPNFPVIPGLGCQNLLIDLKLLVTVNSFTTSSGGSANTNPSNYIPFVQKAVGAHVYTQSIWDDTKNSNAHLSRVSDTTIQPQPAPADFSGKIAYRYGPSTGVIPSTSFTPSGSLVPLFRYR